jgi:hypothetical protein
LRITGRSGCLIVFKVLEGLEDGELLVNVKWSGPERQPTHFYSSTHSPLNSTVLRLFNTTNSSTAAVKDRLTVSLRNTLGEDFTIEVIYHTIKQMKPLAAPCSDSIPALFYQKKPGHLEMMFLQ